MQDAHKDFVSLTNHEVIYFGVSGLKDETVRALLYCSAGPGSATTDLERDRGEAGVVS